jgi:hypothetical protein
LPKALKQRINRRSGEITNDRPDSLINHAVEPLTQVLAWINGQWTGDGVSLSGLLATDARDNPLSNGRHLLHKAIEPEAIV